MNIEDQARCARLNIAPAIPETRQPVDVTAIPLASRIALQIGQPVDLDIIFPFGVMTRQNGHGVTNSQDIRWQLGQAPGPAPISQAVGYGMAEGQTRYLRMGRFVLRPPYVGPHGILRKIGRPGDAVSVCNRNRQHVFQPVRARVL